VGAAVESAFLSYCKFISDTSKPSTFISLKKTNYQAN